MEYFTRNEKRAFVAAGAIGASAAVVEQLIKDWMRYNNGF